MITSCSAKGSYGRNPAETASALLNNLAEKMDGLDNIGGAMLFAGPGEGECLARLSAEFEKAMPEAAIAACSGSGIIGLDVNDDDHCAVSVIAMKHDGASFIPFAFNKPQLAMRGPQIEKHIYSMFKGIRPEVFFLFADSASTSVHGLLKAFSNVFPGVPVSGGVMNSATAGINQMAGFGVSHRTRVVGLAVAGSLKADVMLTHGATPVGPAFTVTRRQGALIYELSGSAARDGADNVLENLPPSMKEQLENGLFIGKLVAGKSPDTAGRGDYVIRKVRGVDHHTGAVVTNPIFETGDIARFHLLDSRTAMEDMELLFTPHKFGNPPDGAIIFTGAARANELFGGTGLDAKMTRELIGQKAPLAGAVCQSEIGPMAGGNYIHGYTACVTLFTKAAQNGAKLD